MKYASNIISGDIGVADVNALKQVRDVTPGLFMLYEDNETSPFLALLSRIRQSRAAWNIKHEWAKKDFFPRWDAISAITSGNGTATIVLTPDNVDYFRKHDTVEVFSSGNHYYFYVSAVSTTVTLKTFDASVATVAVGDKMHIYSNANEELSNSPTGKSAQTDFEYNYPQFLRYPTTIGILELGTRQYTGDERSERVKEQMLEIKMSVERTLHFGERMNVTGPDSEKLVAMRGVKRFTETGGGDNILDWSGGSLTEATFREYLMEGPCKYGSKEKFFPMSTEMWMQIDSWAGTKQAIQSAGGPINILGMSFTRYMAPNGRTLMMHHHHMYEQEYEGWAQIIDLKSLALLPFGKNKLFTLHENIQENDLAGEKHEWRFLATLEISRNEYNGLIKR